ncbi:MAG: hypothetical protein WCV90_05125 [Candidatus Woesearchaeota archaeon]|jgi:hypothetical protein
MDSMLKRGVLIFVLLVSSLFIMSCGGSVSAGQNPTDTATALKMANTGTQGVEISLVTNYPPPLIYDDNELVALVEVKNKGNHDLEPEDCFIQVTGFDPNIIKAGFNMFRTCSENLGTLEGKNEYNSLGGSNQIEFRSTDNRLPAGVFEYNPTLNFVACYNYHTIANPLVCVDPLFYQVTSQQKTCIPHDVGMGGGQAAPVGVTNVGVDMVGSRAIFEIGIQNYGTGRVLSSYSDLRNCGQASLTYTDLDQVYYAVEMSGAQLDCKPRDFVRLVNNFGKIVCSATLPNTAAFETPLMVDLDYNYIQSFTRQIKIVRTPQ